MRTFFETKLGKLYNADCFNILPLLAKERLKFDLILVDLPYGTTKNSWDSIIDLSWMWELLKAIINYTTPLVFTSMQPFTSQLIMSNPKWFRYEWIWQKEMGTGHLSCKYQPLRNHENIIVFYQKAGQYYPQMREGKPYIAKQVSGSSNYGTQSGNVVTTSNGDRYPLTVLSFKRDNDKRHPTQKPIDLLKYLIKTYTKPNDSVLDFTSGVGSTLIAAEELGRKWVGVEIQKDYCKITKERFRDVVTTTPQPAVKPGENDAGLFF